MSRITITIDHDTPKLQSGASLMQDDPDDEESEVKADPMDDMDAMDDEAETPKKKGKPVAGGKKGAVPPQFVKHMRARMNAKKGKAKK